MILSPAGLRVFGRSPVPRSLRRGSVLLCLWAGVLCWGGTAAPARAQVAAAPTATGTIAGLVVDAENARPLAGAHVFLEPVVSVLPALHTRTGPPDFPFAHVIETDSGGAYSFARIPPGRYRVHVERPGYQRTQIDVDLSAGGARVTVGLSLEPIRLPEMHVHTEPAQPYLRTTSHVAERLGARRTAVRQRQVEHLETDVRSLTAGEVAEAVTLGEADLFRALQRMPGVGRRDDYTAVLWTRGAPWVQTRVYFDGMPLYNPTHAGSLFSSISPNGVGAVTYHPGVRSAEWGEGAAGILDLRSRKGRSNGGVSGSADLSLVSAQLALDGDLLDGRVAWMVAGRRTHVDLLAASWEYLSPGNGLEVPYDFADVTTRLDVRIGPVSLEASGLNERDRLRGDIPGLLVGNTGRWGNRVGQVTARVAVGPLEVSATTGATRFATVVHETWRARRFGATGDDEVTLPTLESGIDHDRSGIRVGTAAAAAGWLQWALGYEEVAERIRYDGPFSLLLEGIPGLVPDSVERIPFRLAGRRNYVALWGETRVRVGQRLEVQAGLRVEDGDSVRHHGERLVAPRLSLRWAASHELALSAGWGRSYQYTQAIGATAGPLGPQLHLGHLWVLAGEGFPAIQSDIATAGASLWVRDAWLLGLNAYHRETSGVTEPDPTPGVIRPDRAHVEADGTAYGVEASVRRLVGRWTGSLGMALARAEVRTDSLRYPSSADVRFSTDATAAWRMNDHVRVGGALSLATGAPFTRVVTDVAGGSMPRLGEPGAFRTPRYAGLDLMVDYTGDIAGWDVGAYLQLLNALGRANRITYVGSLDLCADENPAASCTGEPVIRDRFKSGLPRLPLVGFRVTF
jgi:hypothetical protein